MKDTTDCGMLIKRISDSITRISNNELRENDLTLTQIRYLEYLYLHACAPTPFKELEAFFQVSQPTVTGIMRRLESKGLILTQPVAYGGKAKAAVLTRDGARRYEIADARRSEMETRLLAPLNDAEKARFCTLLQKVCQNLKEE